MEVAGTTRWAGEAVSAVLSFSDVVRNHQSMVFSIGLHFLRDRAAAEEIAQDTFLELHRHLGEIESESHAVFWLRKVASRKCIDAVRRRKLRAATALDSIPEPAAREHSTDPMLNRRLQQLIAALPERPRMMVVLRYQEELMPEEIARILEIPVGTVKSTLQRALGVLREKLNRLSGEDRRG